MFVILAEFDDDLGVGERPWRWEGWVEFEEVGDESAYEFG